MSWNKFVASTSLTPLLKHVGWMRPIIVGSIWKRLVPKVYIKKDSKYVSRYLNDFYFCGGVSGGAKAILHSANRMLSRWHKDGSLVMFIIYFLSAFNIVYRLTRLREVRVIWTSISLRVEFLNGHTTRLYYGDEHIM